MHTLPDRQIPWSDAEGQVFLIAAPAGQERHRLLERTLASTGLPETARWHLACNFDRGGLWAGVRELFAGLLERRQPTDLVTRHDYELAQVIPALKRTVHVRNPTLTDVAPVSERVRNYPADRAFRIVHGLIDFLDSWKRDQEPEPWVVAVDDLDQASRIGLRFFKDLMRRRGRDLRLILVAGVAPGAADALAEGFASSVSVTVLRTDLPESPPAAPDPEDAARRARALEAEVGDDIVAIEENLPDLIFWWQAAGNEAKVLEWKSQGQSILNILGFYEDSLTYGYEVLRLAKIHRPEDARFHWEAFNKVFSCHVALGQPQEAYHLAQQEVVGRITDPYSYGQLCYLLAMLHARYLPERDLEAGEKFLEEGVQALERSSVDESQKQFEIVFNRNGLAMIRHFQGRFEEAIELCKTGYETLSKHLATSRHRLHRSVLIYNIAQVYSALRRYDEALEHYAKTIEMDPNYSEYYNEVGNILLRLERLDEAEENYRRAIDLSPPYQEVWTNLGQCLSLQGKAEDAVAAYDRAIDLEPTALLALLGRAQAHQQLGNTREALADYDAAITLAPDEWEALANRASLHFAAGDAEASLADISRALEIVPETPELYQNRAFVYERLGDGERAAADLETCLGLMDAGSPDRPEVEQRLARVAAA